MWLPSRLLSLYPCYCLYCKVFYKHASVYKFIVFQMLIVLNDIAVFFYLPAKPLCLTYFCWYSGLDTVIVEAEPEEAVGDPHRELEWQPDDVM